MKPTNYGENCNQCKMTVNLSNPRKKVIFKEHYNGETYYLSLTDEQIALLSWLTEIFWMPNMRSQILLNLKQFIKLKMGQRNLPLSFFYPNLRRTTSKVKI